MTGKKHYHHGALRRALLDEAALLIREEGEAGLSMRRLAARAGVSRTAPYHHFNDKQDLLCAIAEEGFSRYVRILTLPADDLSEQRMRRFVLDYLTFAVENAEYYDLMFGGQLWRSGAITDSLRAEAHGSFRFYIEQVRSWQERGQVDSALDVLRYSQVSWSTLHGMSRLMIDGVYPDFEAVGPMCDQAAAMFWHELRGDLKDPLSRA
jgi:AcrR family transcriptional regulator